MCEAVEIIGNISEDAPRTSARGGPGLIQAAINAEAAGFDNLLMGYISSRAESWVTAAYVLAHTSKIRVLVAHRPGIIPPTLMARTASTLDMLSAGRVSVNVVSGGSAADQRREGDFLDHDGRYERADEYLSIAKRCWTDSGSFDHKGKYFNVERVHQEVRPVRGHIPIYIGGASQPAKRFVARHSDVYMMWGEPRADVASRIAELRREREACGNPSALRFSLSLRLIIGETSAEAWSIAESMLPEGSRSSLPRNRLHREDEGRNRQLRLAEEKLLHDECLWMGIAAATGGMGATAALVGTRNDILEALLSYVQLGVTCFQLSSPAGGLLDAPAGFFEELRLQAQAVLAHRKPDSLATSRG